MSFTARALRMSAGALVWAAHFLLIYGYTGLACARDAPQAVPWVIGVATLIGVGACGVIFVKEWARREAFESWVAAGLAAFALLAVAWEGLPVLMVAPCA